MAVLYVDANKLLANTAKDSKQYIVQYLLTWSYPIGKFNAIMRKVHKVVYTGFILCIISPGLV